MGKFFTLGELTRSAAAAVRGIDNRPDAAARANLTALIDRVLDPIRQLWGAPVHVTSGYRCAELNAAVGGASRSHHLTGQAADLTTGTGAGQRASNRALFERIAASEIPFCQLIDEQNYAWIHVSYDAQHPKRQILHL